MYPAAGGGGAGGGADGTKVTTLCGFGFDERFARLALGLVGDDVDSAVDLLVSPEWPAIAATSPAIREASTLTRKWEWQREDGTFGAYRGREALKMEQMYCAFVQGDLTGDEFVFHSALVRVRIDFATMTQTTQPEQLSPSLPAPGNQRTLRAKRDGNFDQWEWRRNDGHFEPFSNADCVRIQRRYQQYQVGHSGPIFEHQIPAREYTVNFAAMQQVSRETGFPRAIRPHPWLPLYRWEWDAGQCYRPFSYDDSTLLEHNFSLFRSGKAVAECELSTELSVDFAGLLQTNIKTGTKRPVRRHAVNTRLLSNARWASLGGDGSWHPFAREAAQEIEAAFVKFAETRSAANAVVEIDVGFACQINFTHGMQTNMETNQETKVTRTASGDVHTAAMGHAPDQTLRPISSNMHDGMKMFAVSVCPEQFEFAQRCHTKMTEELTRIAASSSSVCTREHMGHAHDQVYVLLELPEPGALVLHIRAELISISCVLLGVLMSKVRVCNNDQLVTNVHRAPRRLENPRLLQLCTRAKPCLCSAVVQDRNTAMLGLAHCAMWDAGCGIYGGFVRDWVVNGEPANDIDLQLPAGQHDADAAAAAIRRTARALGLTDDGNPSVGGAATLTLQFSSSKWNKVIQLDIVDRESPALLAVKQSPGVASDVDNLLVTQREHLTKRYPRVAQSL
jgi:hypothetical protein